MSVSELSGFDPELLATEALERAEADISRADSLDVGKRVLELLGKKLEVSRGGYIVIYEDELRDVTGAEHPKVMSGQFAAAAVEAETAAKQRLGVAKAATDTAEFLVGHLAIVVDTDAEDLPAYEPEDSLPSGYIHRF